MTDFNRYTPAINPVPSPANPGTPSLTTPVPAMPTTPASASPAILPASPLASNPTPSAMPPAAAVVTPRPMPLISVPPTPFTPPVVKSAVPAAAPSLASVVPKPAPVSSTSSVPTSNPTVTPTTPSITTAKPTKPTFGINGFGRIGRTSFRVWWLKQADKMQLKLINTSGSMEIEDWVTLLKYDSNYGVFATPISYKKLQEAKAATDENPVLGTITIGGQEITVTAQKDPAKIPWKQHGVQVVIESTGVFTSQEKASAHLQAGASKVIISAPPKGGDVPTGIIGVKDFGHEMTVVSNASCTTNCVAPVAQIMHHVFGVKKAMMTTIHSYTDDQNLHDNSHKDMRRARGAAQNIVPTSTGAAISVTEVIPELKGLFDGLAIRVPTPVGSLSDMVFLVGRKVTKEEINKAFMDAASQPQWQGILAVTDEPIVSSDIKGRPESSIVDLSLTNVIDGDMVKVVSWYDNEWGYCNRLIEQVGLV